MKKLIISLILITSMVDFAVAGMNAVQIENCLYSIGMIESNGETDLVGDMNITNHAYGAFQIRQPYLDDVLRFSGIAMREKWGRNLTMKDMTETPKAIWVVRQYLSYYTKIYSIKTEKEPDVSIYARIHNGGPNGWKRKSTKRYAEKVLEMYNTL